MGFGRGGARADSFSGAAHNRLTADWIYAPIKSADQEIRGDLAVLRGRARDLVRNNAYASRFVSLFVENVIGPHGIRLQARVTRANGEFDRPINDRIEEAWEDWCQPENASADGRLSWLDIQQLAARSFAHDGELLVRMLPGFGNAHGFSLQVLDPDQLDHEFDRPAGNGRNEIRMGVEIDSWGRPVNYHLWNRHPSDHTYRDRERVVVSASQVIHLFPLKRAGQTRGVTGFAPVLLDTKMLAGLQEAELVASRTAAAKMGWWIPREGEEGVVAGDAVTMTAAPGTFEFGPSGHEFQTFDPQHPNSAFKDFTKSILRSIATGLGVSYNSLANDLESVNYSSIRAGLLTERDNWKLLQVLFYTHLHRRVYLEWLKHALLAGSLELPSRNSSRWRRHAWLPRGWPWVDPLKDIGAALLAIDGALDSRTRQAGEQGRDYEEILADLDRERQLAAEYGVPLQSGSSSRAAGASPTSADEEKDGDEDAAEAHAWGMVAKLLESRGGHHASNGNGKG